VESAPAAISTQGGGYDASLNDHEQTELIKRLADAHISDPASSSENTPRAPFAVRPGFGTKGCKITIYANFFAIRYPKDLTLYEYNVELNPTERNARARERVFAELMKAPELEQFVESGNIVHDTAQRLIVSSLLPQPLTINVAEPKDLGDPEQARKTYEVVISLSNTMNIADLNKCVFVILTLG
jgi:hypothetical protein